MSKATATAVVTEAPDEAPVDASVDAPKLTPPRRAILDFDLTLSEHEGEETGCPVELSDQFGNPWFNPDGSRARLFHGGPTSEVSRDAVAQNLIEQRENQPRGADGKTRPLTKKEQAQQWEALLREKYIATTRSIDLWRKDASGAFERIPITPAVVRQAFKANPHWVDLCWLEEVRRSLTFRQRAEIALESGEVARGDAAPGVQSNGQADAGAQPDDETQNG